jgi:hypothetical protein
MGAKRRKKRARCCWLLLGFCVSQDQMSEHHAVHDACFSSELILLLARLFNI